MAEGSSSLLTNSQLITKVYFPRLIVPASTVAVALADLLVAGGLMGAMMVWFRFLPPAQIVLLPAFLLLGTAAALGVGFWLSALTVRYRDFRYVVPFMVQFGLYLTPVGYSTASIPEAYRPLFALNPLVGVIEGFRWCLLGVGELGPGVLIPSTVVAAALLTSGFAYFRASERRFADTI
jgi:lipopolysaccharide transport system permease protein